MRNTWKALDFAIFSTLTDLDPLEGLGSNGVAGHPFYPIYWTKPNIDLEFLHPLGVFVEETLKEGPGN